MTCTFRVSVEGTKDPVEFQNCDRPAVALCTNNEQPYCRKHFGTHLDQKWPAWYEHETRLLETA